MLHAGGRMLGAGGREEVWERGRGGAGQPKRPRSLRTALAHVPPRVPPVPGVSQRPKAERG